MIRNSITIILVAFCLQSIGQDKLITTDGRTLEGKVTFELPRPGVETIVLKTEDRKFKLSAHEMSLVEKGNDTYVPIKFGPKYRIMKLHTDGYLGLYYYRFEESHDFGTKFFYKRDGTGIEVPNFGFKKIVSDFLADCPNVADRLMAGEYKKNKLEEVINDYNTCIDKNTVKAKLQIAEVVDTSNPTLDLIDDIKSKIKASNEELLTLLTDIQTKVAQQKSVPKYLIGALEEQTADMTYIKEDIADLLAKLNE